MDVFCIVEHKIRLSEPTRKTFLNEPLAYDNTQAHSMRVKVYTDEGGDENLTGATVTASFLKSNDATVGPINGTISGSVAEVVLPASCYVTPGRFKFTMNLNKTGYSRTVMWVEGMVEKNTSSTIIDPGTPVTNYSTVIANANAAAEAAEEAAANASGYTDAIAPDYDDLTFPVTKGTWCWYNGVLHVANQDISTSESWTSAHWDGAPALTEKLFTLDGAIGIYPEMYGAKGDGTTDDMDALAYAIYDACASGIPVRFSAGKTYLTSGYLNITKRINIYGNGATIKGSGTSQTQVILVDSSEGQFPGVHGKGLIENLTIDANGRGIGINVFKAQGWELTNLDICGFASIGALIRNNFEIFAHNIRIAGVDDPDTIGMQVQANDSRFVNIVTKNVGTGIVNIGLDNFYDHIHSWNTASEIVPTSVMIENQADLHLTEAALDTCSIGIKQASALPVYVSGMSIYRNDNYMPDYFTPVVFGVTSAANAANIKGYGIIDNSDTHLYNLFDVDISSVNKFDWTGNNDVSIQSMGNVPELMDTYELNGEVTSLKSHVSATEIVVQSDSQPIIQLADGSANKAKSYDIQIVPKQEGSGDPSPDNVRPISGWTGAAVTRRGKNLLNDTFAAYSVSRSNSYLYLNGVVPPNFVAMMTLTSKDTSVDVSGCYIGFVADDLSASDSPTKFRWALSNGQIAGNTTNIETTGTTKCCNVMIYPKDQGTFNKIFTRYNVQLELGSTATPYEPYSGADYSIDWSSTAGTVYGGNLHVNEDGSGTLVVDMVFRNAREWTWTDTTNSGAHYFCTTIPSLKDSAKRSILMCNRFKPVVSAYLNPSPDVTITNAYALGVNLNVRYDAIETIADWNTYITQNDVEIVVPLATEETYTLTAPQIALLLGTNNIWADTGNMAVEYIADTKLYIQTLTGHPDEDMTADANIASGKFFMVGNRLFISTSAIASGETIVPGTNCTETNLAAALNTINAD